MIDREFDVRAYEEGYRAGKHDAQVEIQEYAKAVKNLVHQAFPETFKALENE